MHRFEERRVLAKACRGLQPHGAGDATRLVGENIAERVLRHNDIEERRLRQHAHRGIVDEHVIGRHRGVLRFHLFGNLPPQPTRCQHVGLVYHRQMLAPLHGRVEGNF